MLGESANDIWACTFHSACVRILRRDGEKLGYGDNFTIYDTGDSQSLIKRILKDLELDEKQFPPRSVMREISRSKDARIGPAEYLRQAKLSNDYRRTRIGQVYEEYARRLFAANAMDFDDLIACTVTLLLEHEDVRSYWQRRFQYVLVDEYQDTNHLQYLLASTLAGGWGNICVVGDDDQSIYKFRGATIENILSAASFRGLSQLHASWLCFRPLLLDLGHIAKTHRHCDRKYERSHCLINPADGPGSLRSDSASRKPRLRLTRPSAGKPQSSASTRVSCRGHPPPPTPLRWKPPAFCSFGQGWRAEGKTGIR